MQFIFGQEADRIEAVRPYILEALGDKVSLTTALSGLLEVLPRELQDIYMTCCPVVDSHVMRPCTALAV